MLIPCEGCKRHVRSDDTACPFCGVAIAVAPFARPMLEGRLSRAVVFASAVLVAPGCIAQNPPPPNYQQQQPPPPPPDDQQGQNPEYAQPPDFAQPPPDDQRPVRGTTIRGVITNANTGARYANVRVDLQGGAPQSTTTNASGEYVFANVAPGDYSVTVQIPVNPRVGGNNRAVRVDGSPVVADVAITPYEPRYDRSNIPKPYGAPPARKRLV